jgi:protein SCO1/2
MRAPALIALLLLWSASLLWSGSARADSDGEPLPDAPKSTLGKVALRGVTIEQKIGQALPLELRFTEGSDDEAPLARYFGERPIILALIYNRCPMLCGQVLQGVLGSLRVLDLDPGEDFELLAVSFDPEEDPAITADARATFLRRLGRPGAEGGVHFLRGAAEPIAALTDAVGFRYEYDQALDQWAHPSAIMVLTPEGKVARYFFGSEYSPRDLRLALREASDGKVGSITDDLLLLCYRYDPSSGTYSAAVINAIRAGGVATVAALLFFMVRTRRERRARVGAR